jgi:Tfp pilus assembly protein FimT
MRTVRLIALLALAALPGLMGCTHTQQVSRTATAAPSDEQTGRWKAVREIKEASREHAVTVVTLGGRNYRARSVQLQADTLSWLSPDEEVLRRVPFADVHAVEWESYGRGKRQHHALRFQRRRERRAHSVTPPPTA